MTTQPIETPADVTAATDQLRHIYCLVHGTPVVGVCGAPRNIDVRALVPILTHPTPPNRCVVCEDLKFGPCKECPEDD